MLFFLRLFTVHDYEAIYMITTAIYSEDAPPIEELQKMDEQRYDKLLFQRWVADLDGQVVGSGEYTQYLHKYHPQKFFLKIDVHPFYQHRGIGTALYDHLLQILLPLHPILIRAQTRENQPQSVRFLSQRGFQEEQRKWESRLDLATFDATPYLDCKEKLRAQGIEVKTLQELAYDPERNQKLYALDWELRQDVPTPELRNPISYEHFHARFLDDPQIPPDAYFVAVEQENYVGLSFLIAKEGEELAIIGLTGTKRLYRHRGIATALKLEGILYARAHGYKTLRTMNDALNIPILALNKRFGFVKYPQSSIISFVKKFPSEE
jgi:GNAT superfamily N-acetyltransferase